MFQNLFTYILSGTAVTIGVTLVALPMGMLLGLLFALLYIYGGKPVTRLMTLYSTLMRGAPPIVLLFLLYFIIAGAINISAFWAGSIALGIISSGYQMEIFRGAIQSVSSGQMMAARAIGMSRWRTIIYIILPQALRLVIPAWSNEPISLLKSTAIAFLIAVPDLMTRAKAVAARTYDPIGAYFAVAVVYLALVFGLNEGLKYLERRARIPGFEMEGKKA